MSDLKSPRKPTDRVFHANIFSPSDLKEIMGAIRCRYSYLGSKRSGVIWVTPDPGYEKAVCTLLSRVFGHPDYLEKERREFLLKSSFVEP